jgi:Flp pilus assembly protein TadD
LIVNSNEAASAKPGQPPAKIVLTAPRDRIQWVNALSADPLRHFNRNDVPIEFKPVLSALDKGDINAAGALIEQLSSTPDTWVALFRSAHAILSGETLAARRQLVNLIELSPGLPVASLMLSDVQLIDGESDAALVTLTNALRHRPNHPALLAQLARTQMLADRINESLQTLALARPADDPNVLLAQGELAQRQGQPAQTLQAFIEAGQKAPADDRAWYGLGRAQNELEQTAKARANLNIALALKPGGAGYQGELGTLETYANHFVQAERAFATALKHHPDDYVALTGLGLLRLKQGRVSDALDALLRAGVMEPRYARAKAYTAVAYYQIERQRDAIETLRQASMLDDKDPLPYLLLSQIFTDLVRPGEAVQASRDAVDRLPYLKSLNQVANDQKGSANFGASLAFFGLEQWALELAQRSFDPHWGASHLFLADRTAGEFSKNSELFQGFLSDPLSFGASNRFSTLLQRAGHYSTLELNYDKSAPEILTPSITLNGLSNNTIPVAYFVQAQQAHATGFPIDVGTAGSSHQFEDPTGRSDIDTTVSTIGIGVKPTEKLGLFAYHNAFTVDLQGHNAVLKNGAVDGSETTSTVYDIQVKQTALGMSYRWSPKSMTWLKFGQSKTVDDIAAYPAVFASSTAIGLLGLYAKPDKQFDDVQLRHIEDINPRTRFTVGLEHVKETQYSEVVAAGPLFAAGTGGYSLSNYLVFGGTNSIARGFDALDIAWQQQLSEVFLVDATLVANRLTEQVHGNNALLDVIHQTINPSSVATNEITRILAPRLGIVYQPSTQWSLRGAYQDWVRPLSVSTLGNLQTAGIGIEDRLLAAGGRVKRGVVQLAVTMNQDTFLSGRLDHQSIHNPVAPGVDLRTPSLPFLEALRNPQNVNLSSLDILEDVPDLEDANLNAWSVGFNRLFTPKLSGYLSYFHQNSSASYADSSLPGGRVDGLQIAYVPRNAFVIGASWAPGRQSLLGMRATYRSERFEDKENLTPWPASWSLDLLGSWETPDKRWAIAAGALNLGGKKSDRQHPRYVVDARLRF